MPHQNKNVEICAVGDLAAFYSQPESMFVHTSEILMGADITFGQNERFYIDNYSDQDLMPGVPLTEHCPRSHATALKAGGFDVISFASNHAMDLGPGAMLDTISALQENGSVVIGAGRNIGEARRPAILERNGLKVAFLAYCSVGRTGWEADMNRPGVAPLRASTFYHQVDYQPGTAPEIITKANREDLDAMRKDIARAREHADVVVVTCHWGLHYVRGTLAMYEQEIAHAAIDAGADLILGTHPHVLKGIEVYKGKAIFYSLGNFAFDLPLSERLDRQKRLRKTHKFTTIKADPEYAEWYSWPEESRVSMIMKCRASPAGISEVSFLPVLINCKAQPEIVISEDGIQRACENIRELSSSQGFDTSFTIDNGAIVVKF